MLVFNGFHVIWYDDSHSSSMFKMSLKQSGKNSLETVGKKVDCPTETRQILTSTATLRLDANQTMWTQKIAGS